MPPPPRSSCAPSGPPPPPPSAGSRAPAASPPGPAPGRAPPALERGNVQRMQQRCAHSVGWPPTAGDDGVSSYCRRRRGRVRPSALSGALQQRVGVRVRVPACPRALTDIVSSTMKRCWSRHTSDNLRPERWGGGAPCFWSHCAGHLAEGAVQNTANLSESAPTVALSCPSDAPLVDLPVDDLRHHRGRLRAVPLLLGELGPVRRDHLRRDGRRVGVQGAHRHDVHRKLVRQLRRAAARSPACDTGNADQEADARQLLPGSAAFTPVPGGRRWWWRDGRGTGLSPHRGAH